MPYDKMYYPYYNKLADIKMMFLVNIVKVLLTIAEIVTRSAMNKSKIARCLFYSQLDDVVVDGLIEEWR